MKEDKSWGGPAVQDLKDFLTLSALKPGSVKVNTGLSTDVRFPRIKRYVNPGPGTYRVEKPKACVRITNQPPPFEWDGFQERFKRKSKGSGLAANRYYFIEPPPKIISLRGPYDLFTGPRDGSTIKNHFAPPKRQSPDWLPTMPTEMDRLKRPEHEHKGKWRTGDRFLTIPTSRIMISSITLCRKDPNSPSPAEYDPEYLSQIVENVKYPGYGIGVTNVRPETEFKIQPGSGRYFPKLSKRHVSGHRDVFVSKSPRTLSLVKPKLNAF